MCYNEITPRMFLGGYVNRDVNVNILRRAGVTHIVNTSQKRLSPFVQKQFWTLDILNGDIDYAHNDSYWEPVFDFTRTNLLKPETIMYFHICPEARPVSPVAVYAALRALGYSDLHARRKLIEAHPILKWQDIALREVVKEFELWCKHRHLHPSLPASELTSEENTIDTLQLLAGRSSVVQDIEDLEN
jgi:hypothetical protein